MTNQQVVVIGGGPGGYVAAIRAAQLGGVVTLIEKKRLGGTCLNVGCIPTKAMLHSAQLVQDARQASLSGVRMTLEGIDWSTVIAHKDLIVNKLVGGVEALMRANKIKIVEGTARFLKPKTLEIERADGKKEVLEAGKIIIATGAVPVVPPIEGLLESRYAIDSTGALSLDKLPADIIIIGGGVIGVELACVFQALGCKATIVEALPHLIPTLDAEISDQLRKCLVAQGIEVLLGHKVERVVDGNGRVTVKVSHQDGERALEADRLLVAVGRRPFLDDLNPEACGIKLERGRILANEHLETNIPGVYAIGDCLGQTMLAHTASAQGEVAAENAMGKNEMYRPGCVPSGVYSFPEVASAGMTEEMLKEKKIPYHVGRFPLLANGRSLILNNGEGMIKVLIGDEMDELLGVHILGPNATELIGEAAVAIEMEATADEIIRTIHAHPTVTEALREAVLAAEKRAIHIVNK